VGGGDVSLSLTAILCHRNRLFYDDDYYSGGGRRTGLGACCFAMGQRCQRAKSRQYTCAPDGVDKPGCERRGRAATEAPVILTSSVGFAATSSIKEEERRTSVRGGAGEDDESGDG
tara:strand:- start:4417 stop:4764 length:348 start_codon:yes stop_codon:yes gene_type:complete